MSDIGFIPTTIERDLPCAFCGYNLRSLNSAALCPECGREVALSLRGDYLIHDSPSWLAQLVRGTTLLLISVSVLTFFSITAFLATWFDRPWYDWLRFFWLASPLLEIVGIWKISSRETAFDTSQTRSFRTAVRAFAVFAFILTIPLTFNFCVLGLVVFLFPVLSGLRDLFLLLWLRRHATRVPNRTLATQCLVLPFFSMPVYFLNPVLWFTQEWWWQWPLSQIQMLFLVVQIVGTARAIWQLILMIFLRNCFAKVAAAARQMQSGSTTTANSGG